VFLFSDGNGLILMKAIRFSLFLAFLYLVVLQLWAVWSFTIDDMYITLRYAKNWSDGYGLLWNIGEPPVEGYSNYSFVLLARLAMILHFNPVTVLKGAGVIGLISTCWAIYAIARMWFLMDLALIPCLWLLAYKGQILWSVGGLETTVYQALVCFALFFIFRGRGYSSYPNTSVASRSLSYVISGLLLALAGMTRPEAPALMLMCAILLVVFRVPGSNHRDWRGFFLFCGTLMVCFTPYFFWRWHYYGHLFPNPVYCKGFTNFLKFDLDKQYLRLIWPFAFIALPALYRGHDQRYYFLWLPSVLYLLLLIGADPIVAFDNRLFLPAFALLLPLSLQGVASLVEIVLCWDHRGSASRGLELLSLVMYLIAFLVAFFFIPMMSLKGYRLFTEDPLAGEQLRENVVTWLKRNTRPHSRVVLADSGLIPYKSRDTFIDSYCLNNAEMTKHPPGLMYQYMCETVIKEKPEVIILTALLEDGKVLYTPTDACLSLKLAHSNHYCMQISLGVGDEHSFYRYEIFSSCLPSKQKL